MVFAWSFYFCLAIQKAETPDFSSVPAVLRAGDERIELPPKVLETPIIPFDQSPTYIKGCKCYIFYKHILFFYTLQSYKSTLYLQNFIQNSEFFSWSSLRSISNSQLHTLLYFHLCPIYLVLFKGSYLLKGGDISS